MQVLELLNALVDGGHKSSQEAILREVLISASPSFLPALFATVRSYDAKFHQKAVRDPTLYVQLFHLWLCALRDCGLWLDVLPGGSWGV